MKPAYIAGIFILLLCLPDRPAARTVRAGLFAGNNRGSFAEDVLFYAAEDAMKMFLTFQSYGGLDRNLSLLVQGADRDELESRLGELGQRIQLLQNHGDDHVECIFYYSGHGGTEGLHIEGRTYAYRDLHADLEALSCDLLIVVLDACNSGNALGVKGVKFHEDEFRVKIYDSRKGEVFMTSSADSEYSQERDEFKGSVFTYYLVNGLVGAADANRDGLVTLSEAYNFASKKTVRETFGSARGFQMPTYRYEVEGRQDTVLTELRGKQAVAAPPGRRGIMTFMDVDRGIIWGDFSIEGDKGGIVLPPGNYLVRLREPGGKLLMSRCRVGTREEPPSWEKFEVITPARDPLKGERILHHWTIRMTGDVLLSPDDTVIRNTGWGGSLSFLVDNIFLPPLYAGVSLGLVGGSSSQKVFGTDVSRSSLLTTVDGILGIGWRVNEFFEAGGELRMGGGYVVAERDLPGNHRRISGYVLHCGLGVQALWWVSRDIGLVVPALQAALLTYEKQGSLQNTFDFGIRAGLQLRF